MNVLQRLLHKETTTQEGKYLGPVDWTFDFETFYKPPTPTEGNDKEHHEKSFWKAMNMFHRLSKHPEQYEATSDGRHPRCCWRWNKVLRIGMYKGWPYQKSVPSVCLSSQFGDIWYSFADITDIRKVGEDCPMKIEV